MPTFFPIEVSIFTLVLENVPKTSQKLPILLVLVLDVLSPMTSFACQAFSHGNLTENCQT
jgi:hypothetical protein